MYPKENPRVQSHPTPYAEHHRKLNNPQPQHQLRTLKNKK